MIGITGHTKGLGQIIYNHYNLNIIGFSRTNGFDISNQNNRKNIIDILKNNNCDIFINNAYDRFNQVNMLIELYNEWKDDDKLIINIGSLSKYGIRNNISYYSVCKKSLSDMVLQLINNKNKCKLCLINFDYLETDRIINQNITNYIKRNDIIKIIDFIITNRNNFNINEITVAVIP